MPVAIQTVRDIALANPGSVRVFERFGIDYCCGGRIPLDEACERKNLNVNEVLAALENEPAQAMPGPREWIGVPLGELAAHIVNTHHAYVYRELPRLRELAQKVVNRHGDTKPELPIIEAKVGELAVEMTQHQAKEEVILFPHISRLERAVRDGSARPMSPFGTVANPIAMMTREHVSAGALMAEIRRLCAEFTPPPSACPTFIAFYSGLHDFERDLHQHIHLENNILFPRAIALEASA